MLSEKAARRELAFLLGLIIYTAVFPDMFSFVCLALGFVVVALECLNTAIELLCNMKTLEYNAEIRKIKDTASASIFILLIGVFVLFALSVVGRLDGIKF